MDKELHFEGFRGDLHRALGRPQPGRAPRSTGGGGDGRAVVTPLLSTPLLSSVIGGFVSYINDSIFSEAL